MKSVYFAAPAILCGFACFVGLVGVVAPSKTKLTQAVLYAFLPGCFLLSGAVMMMMRREIRRLRHRMARLEGRKKGSSRPEAAASEDTLADTHEATLERNGYGQLQSSSAPAQNGSPTPAGSEARTVAV